MGQLSETNRVEIVPVPPRPLWMRAREVTTRRAWLKTVLVAAGASLLTAVFVWLAVPRWKPTGDGKTIVNVWTGELRITTSGRSVEEVRAEQVQESDRRQAEARAYLVREEFKREASRQRDEANRARVHAHNSAIYHSVKGFVDEHPDVYANGVLGEWTRATRPFRTNKMLSRAEHEKLLDILGRAIVQDKHKGDPEFLEAIEQLKKWDFTYTPRF